MFATTDLIPLLAERGVTLSREQVYRLVVKVPERLNLTALAALCDILDCTPTDLIEPHTGVPTTARSSSVGSAPPARPRRARVTPAAGSRPLVTRAVTAAGEHLSAL